MYSLVDLTQIVPETGNTTNPSITFRTYLTTTDNSRYSNIKTKLPNSHIQNTVDIVNQLKKIMLIGLLKVMHILKTGHLLTQECIIDLMTILLDLVDIMILI